MHEDQRQVRNGLIGNSSLLGLFYRDRRNLSFPGLIHQYGRCFLKDGSQGLSNGSTNYLNCCLFCLPPPPLLSVLRQTSEEHFQEQKGTHIAAANLALGHTGDLGIVSPPFIHPHLISALIHSPKSARSSQAFYLFIYFCLFNQITIPIHDTRGVFPCPRWVLGADRISSTPKCFPFLPLFIFFPFLIGLCFSIRPPTHALCHVL